MAFQGSYEFTLLSDSLKHYVAGSYPSPDPRRLLGSEEILFKLCPGVAKRASSLRFIIFAVQVRSIFFSQPSRERPVNYRILLRVGIWEKGRGEMASDQMEDPARI